MYLGTGCGMSLVDVDWLHERLPNVAMMTRASAVNFRGIGNVVSPLTQYVVLQFFVPAEDGSAMARICREFHAVKSLDCKMLIGADVIKPEGIVMI